MKNIIYTIYITLFLLAFNTSNAHEITSLSPNTNSVTSLQKELGKILLFDETTTMQRSYYLQPYINTKVEMTLTVKDIRDFNPQIRCEIWVKGKDIYVIGFTVIEVDSKLSIKELIEIDKGNRILVKGTVKGIASDRIAIDASSVIVIKPEKIKD